MNGRGPFAERDPWPADPFPRIAGGFLALAAPIHDVIQSGGSVLGASRDQVARDVPTDIDSSFAATVDVARNRHSNEVASGTQSQADRLIDRSYGADARAGQSLRYLPGPETDITQGYIDAPYPDPRDPDTRSPYRPRPPHFQED